MTNEQTPINKPQVLVAGAGLAGVTAAHHLAEWGAQVHLVDIAPYIGGAFLFVDHTFTTDSCGLCIALPRQPSYCPTIASELHPHITPFPCTRLVALEEQTDHPSKSLGHRPSTSSTRLSRSGHCFVATLRREPCYVEADLCDNCGACAAVCPVTRPNPYDGELSMQTAIYAPPLCAVPLAYGLDPETCTRCGACVEVCPHGAIDLEAIPVEEQIEADAVVLAPGFAFFDATHAAEYGWTRCPNVLTNLQFERMLSRPGPTGGRVLRPSDGEVPRRLAFIHCVGSRNESLGRPYCSTSCCMITAKQVGLAKEIVPEAEMTVFTMDVRAAGKGYERYFQRVAALPGVEYRRGMVSAVQNVPGTQNLRLLTPDGEEEYDLVVLAVGLGPVGGLQQLATCAGVALDEHGFVLPGRDGPGTTSRPGVFAIGANLPHVDVPETVTQATGAAALAAGLLVQYGSDKTSEVFGQAVESKIGLKLRQKPLDRVSSKTSEVWSPITEKTGGDGCPPPAKGDKGEGQTLTDQPPRVGLFLCTCHGDLEKSLDFPALEASGQRLRAVAHVERLGAACERSGLDAIARAVAEHGLNRIVVAGCSPRLHADRFERLMARLDLPARLLARANVREGAAWPHASTLEGPFRWHPALLEGPFRWHPALLEGPFRWHVDDPAGATAVAEGEIGMAVAGLRETPYRAFHPRAQEETVRRVLVLGGGLAGMTAALTLADLGVACDVLERELQLGGNLRMIQHTLEEVDVAALREGLIERVQRAERVRVWTEAELADWSGVRGDFTAQIRDSEGIRAERYGALIVATGAEEAATTEYLYGRDPRVVTQRELEQMVGNWETGGPGDREIGELGNVVMIQCVGSRNEAHPYCSRVCCAQAVKNALALKGLDPDIEISVLFRDIRTLGLQELYYQQARRMGVRFLRYEPPDVPAVEADGERLHVTVHDTLFDETVVLEADLLALSTGIVAHDNAPLAEMLGVPLDEDGFFAEVHPKLRPIDLPRPGLFVCGLAYGPRFITETIAQARAAALRAALVVARPLAPRRDVATVEADLCSLCGLCVAACPYGARVLDKEARFARVLDHLCQGCGACVAVCPNGASRQPAFEPVGALALVDAALV